MAVTYLADLSGLFNTIYEGALLVAREQNLMTGLVDSRSATGWMNRVVPIRPQLAAAAVAENVDLTPATFGKSTAATLTPGEIGIQVALSDREMATDPDGATVQAIQEMGGAIATKIDVDLMANFTSFTASKGADAAALSLAIAAAALAKLVTAHALQYGRPSIVLHPYQWHDIWVELGKPTANVVVPAEFANQALRDYFVGNMLAANWFISMHVPMAATNARGAAFVRPALMIDTRRAMRLEAERDASARTYELNVTAGYATGIVRQAFGVKIISDATEV